MALLSQPVTSISTYLSLVRLPQATNVLDNRYEHSMDTADPAGADFSTTVNFLLRDKCFTRLWTFNERRCCRQLHYAVVASLEMVDMLLALAREPDLTSLLVLLLQTPSLRGESLRQRCALDFYINSDSLYKPLHNYRHLAMAFPGAHGLPCRTGKGQRGWR